VDDDADDAVIERIAATALSQIDDAELKDINKSVLEILVDLLKRDGRIRTSTCTLRTGPGETHNGRRAIVVRENKEELVLLGNPSVRVIRCFPQAS